ncbi:hypothetical protein KHC33_04680 [Methanospirillum sp. J.3.6.1-F.2.7.3]|uniref:Flagellin n=1 Tax=Methanospirillum purgamenti TaxID=2834276 RepID=A0A8E7EHW4_9EURY|nr:MULTISPECIES: flagellin [Methanospirillum]MDX8550653.1 flagellin [Methanospirillum hungatei]QVV89803.1 hypothetical protein KHC33_04680 [Methanospirillum sp. J.3.6.1-F.2.7.3]
MASEAISSSIMIIGAVLGAAVLITAILPAIFSAGDTFGTVSSSAEQKLKTDFRIVNTYTAGGTEVQVWMKNVGNNRISTYDIEISDVFLGIGSEYGRLGYDAGGAIGTFKCNPIPADGYWDVGETLEIFITNTGMDPITVNEVVSFTFTLPNSVRRSVTFSLT